MNLRTGWPATNLATPGSASAALAHGRLVGARGHRDPARAACRSPAPRSRPCPARARTGPPRPALVHDERRVPELAPHRLRGVRNDRREHQHDEVERLLHHRAARRRCDPRTRASAFSNSIVAAIAVLKVRRRPMSSPTLTSASCTLRRNSRCRPVECRDVRACRPGRPRRGRARSSRAASGTGTRPPRPRPTIRRCARAARSTS